MRSMTRANPDSVSGSGKVKCGGSEWCGFCLSDAPLSVSQEALRAEQQADVSLKGLFEQVLPEEEARNSSQCYFMHNMLLVRKWVPHGDDFIEEPVFQVALPTKFRESVLKLAHESGHWGVRKTYDQVLRHFFWPRLKKDVSVYIKTCHTCQLTGKPNQSLTPAPLFPSQLWNSLLDM